MFVMPFVFINFHFLKFLIEDLNIYLFIYCDFQSRGSTRDGTGVHDSIVNQLLTKVSKNFKIFSVS